MKSLSIQYPESVLATLNLSTDDFEKEAKLALAVKLFELGRLTSGQAAQLAEMSRFTFLLSCGSYGAPSVQWDDEELKAEFESMP
jgi:predicted HTH domain antitoxin